MFIGEYNHNIDEKNRIVIPSKFRELLGDKFIITKGFEKCLYVLPLSEWEKLTDKLKSLPFTMKDARLINRYFLSSALDIECDKSGRINISMSHINYSDIKKECTIIGVNDRVEIWAKDVYDNYILDNIDNIEMVAEGLFDGD